MASTHAVTATIVVLDRRVRIDRMRSIISAFAKLAHLESVVTVELQHALAAVMDVAGPLDRQKQSTDQLMTLLRFGKSVLCGIDPPHTPGRMVQLTGLTSPQSMFITYTIPTKEVDTLVIATDGSRPRSGNARVRERSDLVAVNATFSEQTIVALRNKF